MYLSAGLIVGIASSSYKNASIDGGLEGVRILQPIEKLTREQKEAIVKYYVLTKSGLLDKKNGDAAICGVLWNGGDCILFMGKDWPPEGLTDNYDQTDKFCIAVIGTVAESNAITPSKAIEYLNSEFTKYDGELKNILNSGSAQKLLTS